MRTLLFKSKKWLGRLLGGATVVYGLLFLVSCVWESPLSQCDTVCHSTLPYKN